MQLDRYKQNLCIRGNHIVSYETHVATIDHENETVTRHGWWSSTTSKHINYAASYLKYKVVDEGGE